MEYMKNRIEWATKDAEYRFETIFEKLELISQKSNIPTSQPEKGNEDYDEIRQDYLRLVLFVVNIFSCELSIKNEIMLFCWVELI